MSEEYLGLVDTAKEDVFDRIEESETPLDYVVYFPIEIYKELLKEPEEVRKTPPESESLWGIGAGVIPIEIDDNLSLEEGYEVRKK